VVIPETVRENEVIHAGVLPEYVPGLGTKDVLIPMVPVADEPGFILIPVGA
jgi:hypothetical protein